MKKILIVSLLLGGLLITGLAQAQTNPGQILPDDQDRANWGWDEVFELAQNIAYFLLMLVAGIAVIYIIIGGYQYMLSGGSSEAIQQAKNTITWAVLGLILALSAVLIVRYFMSIVPSHPPDIQLPDGGVVEQPASDGDGGGDGAESE